MTTTIIVAVILIWVFFSAALVLFLCMNASRLSQVEELPRDHRPRRSGYRKAKHGETASSVLAGSGIVRSD
jgi:hypothetical protein